MKRIFYHGRSGRLSQRDKNPDSISPDQDYYSKAKLVTPPKRKDFPLRVSEESANLKVSAVIAPKLHTMLKIMDP